MLLTLVLVSYIFNARYFTNFHNAFSFVKVEDTIYAATVGGVVSFSPSSIKLNESTFDFPYRVFTTVDGLRRNYILDIDADSGGNLWVAVKDVGIQVKRRNSDKFETYELPIVTLRKAKILKYYGEDYYLIGTNYGLLVLKTNSNFDPSDDRIYPPLLIRDTVKFISKGKNFAYIVTPSNIYGWTPDSTFRVSVPLNFGEFGIVQELNEGILYSSGMKVIFNSAETTLVYDAGTIYTSTKKDEKIYIGTSWGTYVFENRRLRKILNYPSACIIPVGDSEVVFTFFSSNREFSYYGPPWRLFDGSKVYQFRSPVLFNLITALKVKNGIYAAGILAWTSDTLSLPSKLLIFDGNEFYNGESLRTINHAIRTLDIDDSGNVWVGLYSDNSPGIFIFDKFGRLTHIINDLPTTIICHISIAKDTVVALWLNGIYRIHKKGSEFSAEEVYRVDYPFYIEQPGDGSYLIGTENEGLIVIDTLGTELLRLTPSELGSSLVSVAKKKGEKIYLGTSNGLLVYQSQNIKKIANGYVRDMEFYKNFVVALTDSAILLISNDSVLYSFRDLNSPFTPIDEPYYQVRDVLEILGDGTIVAGGEEGILEIKVLFPELRKKTFRVFPNPARVGDRVYVGTVEEPSVYDLTMRRLPYKAQKEGDLFYFDTSGWAKGIYLIVSDEKEPAKILLR
ncbi:MAG: hypothetical protein ABIM45_02505 [candidate division WOR-3 bacterium]